MRHFIYIFSDTRKQSIHLGYCKDILKAVAFFKEMPTLFYKPDRQNLLVHLEIADNEMDAKNRFEQIFKMDLDFKHVLIEGQNPHWIELIPNINIEI